MRTSISTLRSTSKAALHSTFFPSALGIALLLLAQPAAGFDRALYAELLERHTRVVSDLAGTRVDYRALQKSQDWKRLVRGLSRADLEALDTRDARLAFWINAYNIAAIDLVVNHYPVDSIRDIGSLLFPVWTRDHVRVGGTLRSLDEIEKEILAGLGEPRVHAALVCASASCPPLLREPWSADRLGAQFDAALRAWLADPRKGMRIDRESKTLTLSKIFKWYRDDFAPLGGVVAFVSRHVGQADRAWLMSHEHELALRWFDYDWSLNGID